MLALLGLFLPLVYVGGIIDPRGNTEHLPIAVVNSDAGAELSGRRARFGGEIANAIVTAPDPGDRVDWQLLSPAEAEKRMRAAKIYGIVHIPEDFTATSLALTRGDALGPPRRPEIETLTNPGAGSFGVSLAAQVMQRAVHEASVALGRHLAAQATEDGKASNAARALLADPVAVTTAPEHPLGERSGSGLTAFYYSLMLVLAGFLGATVISNSVDTGLGYTAVDLGPWRRRQPLVPVSRSQLFAVTSTMSVVFATLTATLCLVATVGILDMDASHLGLLWVFSFCATAAVGIGTQALLAVFGNMGQLIAMFVFVALALPSSGATVPLQAVPDFYRVLARFEPLRPLSDGVRAILYFDANPDAGLTRAWVMIGIGAAIALAGGLIVTRSYDRRGYRRAQGDEPLPAPTGNG
ncbi:DUF3533 domain-containing protein [Streptomyces vinaceus]|uniref:DUF3533 domain-containing protein n=1 Tax=Streptomyces vinaceus TaxID=1960 RepID=UPI0038287984